MSHSRSPRLRLLAGVSALVVTAVVAVLAITGSLWGSDSDPDIALGSSESTTTVVQSASSTIVKSATTTVVQPASSTTGAVAPADDDAEPARSDGELPDRPPLDVTDIAAYVAERRGGSFSVPVEITWIRPTEAAESTRSFDFVSRDLWQVLRATGAVSVDDDWDAINEARRAAVKGWCCNPSGIVLVENMAFDEATVVASHEITHFYDGQEVGAVFAVSSELVSPALGLREGNATRIMRDYRDERGLTLDLETRDYESIVALPVAIARFLKFHYLDGEVFARALERSGGEAKVDEALSNGGPTSTEQILHPASYLSGDEPLPVVPPEPPAGAIVSQVGTMGAFVLALAAESALGWPEAVELVDAWSGDGFIAWTADDQECLNATIEMDDTNSASQLANALGGAATNNTVSLETCN